MKFSRVDQPKHFTFEVKHEVPACYSTASPTFQKSSSPRPKLVSFKRKACSSIYKGVLFVKKQSKWRAQICYKSKKLYIGSYDTEVEAAVARDEKVKQLFGNTNQDILNFPDDMPEESVNKEEMQHFQSHGNGWTRPFLWGPGDARRLIDYDFSDPIFYQPYDLWPSLDPLEIFPASEDDKIISPRILKRARQC